MTPRPDETRCLPAPRPIGLTPVPRLVIDPSEKSGERDRAKTNLIDGGPWWTKIELTREIAQNMVHGPSCSIRSGVRWACMYLWNLIELPRAGTVES